MLTGSLQHHPWPLLQWGVVLGAALVAAATDLRARRIPNALTLPVLALGLAQAFLVAGSRGLLDSTLGCVAAALPYVLLFLYAGGGAGDAKLMGALGAWLGLIHALTLLVAVSVAGIVFGLLYARSHGRLREALASLVAVFWTSAAAVLGGGGVAGALQSGAQPAEGSLRMPYGVAILLGSALAATTLLF